MVMIGACFSSYHVDYYKKENALGNIREVSINVTGARLFTLLLVYVRNTMGRLLDLKKKRTCSSKVYQTCQFAQYITNGEQCQQRDR